MASKKSSSSKCKSGSSKSKSSSSKNSSALSKEQKQAVKYAKKHPKIVVAAVIILTIIVAAFLILYLVKPDIFKGLLGNPDSSGGTGSTQVAQGDLADITSAELSIHFIDFKNDKAGDCTLIKVGDTEVLIDAGSTQASAAVIKEYVDKYCTDGKLEYVIATHADQDHIAGMVGTSSKGSYNGILYSYKIGTVIRFTDSNKDLTTDAGNPTLYSRFLTAVDYAVENDAVAYTALQCWNETDGASKKYYLDAEHKISMNILYNYFYDHKATDENDYSVCMLLTQELDGGKQNNYLFTGDLEEKGEQYLVQKNKLPEVELFKAGHHGSPTSSNDCLLSVIKPKYVAVCCCAGTDEYTDNKNNQFPSQAFIDRISVYTDAVYCLNVVSDKSDKYELLNGDIVFYAKASVIKLWCSNNTDKLKDTEWFKANRKGWGIG